MAISSSQYLLVVCWILLTVYAASASKEKYDPCCSLPCQRNGVCMSSTFESYECDCTGTGYYGRNCEIPTFSTKIRKWMKPSKKTLHFLLTHFSLVWKVVNRVTWMRKSLMKLILKVRLAFIDEPSPYNAFMNYPSWESYSNKTVYVRTLPAIPKNCPTPMGVRGKATLPDAGLLVEKYFARRRFEPCSRRTSLAFPLFAQHFTHQFFKTDAKKGLPYQWGENSIDLSHIYGGTNERQHALRQHVDGKMKFSLINGEVFPPHIDDANVTMDGMDKVPHQYRFAIGHHGFTMQPMLIFFSTIWLREHNRVCDILKTENPSWDDERLFQTARLILNGETMKIVVEDYVQHLSGYNFKLIYDPEMVHGTGLSYHNQISVEFQLLYRWHALIPDKVDVNGNVYPIRNLIFNPKPFVDAGMAVWVRNASRQFAGKVAGGRTQGYATLNVARKAIEDGRRLRLQPFNKYRERFGLEPYKSFYEFIEDPEMARELEELYGDVDAMELFPALMLEKPLPPLLFGQTLTEMGSPYSLKGIFSNPIGSPAWWKPSTFGGKEGFDIIKTTTLQDLVCRNVDGCPTMSFQVPDDVAYSPVTQVNPQSDNSSQILMKINKGDHVHDEVISEPEIDVSVRDVAGTDGEIRKPKVEL